MTRETLKKVKSILLTQDAPLVAIGPDRLSFKERLVKSIAQISASQSKVCNRRNLTKVMNSNSKGNKTRT